MTYVTPCMWNWKYHLFDRPQKHKGEFSNSTTWFYPNLKEKLKGKRNVIMCTNEWPTLNVYIGVKFDQKSFYRPPVWRVLAQRQKCWSQLLRFPCEPSWSVVLHVSFKARYSEKSRKECSHSFELFYKRVLLDHQKIIFLVENILVLLNM